MAAGAEVAAGGDPIAGPGAFYRPTVLRAHDENAIRKLAGVFGPVVIVRGVARDEEAIAAANSGPFGLAASVWAATAAALEPWPLGSRPGWSRSTTP